MKRVKFRKWFQVVLEFIMVISFILFLGSDSEDLIIFIFSHLVFLCIFLLSNVLLDEYGR